MVRAEELGSPGAPCPQGPAWTPPSPAGGPGSRMRACSSWSSPCSCSSRRLEDLSSCCTWPRWRRSVATLRRFSTPSLIFSSFWMARRITSFSSSGGRWPTPGCGMAEDHATQCLLPPASAHHRQWGTEAGMAPRTHAQGLGSLSDCRARLPKPGESPKAAIRPRLLPSALEGRVRRKTVHGSRCYRVPGSVLKALHMFICQS